MEFGLPDNGNEYSSEGTCAHAVAAMCLTEGKPATAYIGRRVDVGPHETYEFREDMAEPVQCYVDFVNSLPGEKFYEVRLPIDHMTFEEGAEGTADVISITEDEEELICADLKFGVGVRVNAEKNKQGMMYASAALRRYDALGSIKRVRIFVHQPRVNEVPSEWDCTVEELRAFEAEVSEAAKTATIAFEFRENWLGKPDDDQYLVAGDEQCQFCKAKPTCPALKRFVEKSVGADLDILAAAEAPRSHEAKQITAQTLVPQNPAALATALKATALVEDWIKAVRAEAERRLLAGEPVPGYKLVQGRMGNRAWNDEAAVETVLRKSFRMPVEEAYTLKLISPTMAEARLAKEHPKRWDRLQSHITRSPGNPSVAPESDKRPALLNNVADDFDEAADLA